jgi:hypothetical protein
MMTDIDAGLSGGPSLDSCVQQDAGPLLTNCDEALALCRAAEVAWASLQAVPSYVEQQARAFVQACDTLGIEAQAEG